MTLEALEKRLRGLSDGPIALALAVLTILSRIPFRTQYLFNWDAGNFALALGRYDVTQHQPHPPGYFFYVMVGRWLQTFAGEANAALVAESILFSGAAVAAVYLFGARLFGRVAGIVGALLLATSVTFWSFGELALSYVTLAFFSTTIAYLAYRTILTREDLSVPLAAVYGLAGGFRAELVVFFFPLFLAALVIRPRRAPVALAAAATAIALWLVPTVWLSGGIDAYYAAFRAYTEADVVGRYTPLEGGVDALAFTLRDLVNYTGYALYALALPLVAAAALWLARLVRQGRRAFAAREVFLLVWPAPMVLFYAFVHIGDPGYVFSFLPALVLLAARFLSLDLPRLAGGSRPAAAWLAPALLVALVNGGLFLFRDQTLTAPGLRRNDAAVAARLDYLRKQDYEATVLLSFDSYKHLRYYVPQYRDSHWVDLFSDQEHGRRAPAGATRLLLVDERLFPLFAPASALRPLDLGAARIAEVPLRGGAAVVYSRSAIRVED
jgi:4-amino-4-deoxy-L-arabinose transferase-like glycosyltransferase